MYYSDQPIQDSNGDKLGRKPFAMRVAHAIMDLHSRDCFTVSLQGKWGCGKTSIINMILAEIERTSNDSQIRVIRFNPWNFTDTTQLINQFFVALSSNLKVGNPADKASRVGEAIEKYSVAFECAKFIPFIGQYANIVPDIIKALGQNIKEVGDRYNDIVYQKTQVEKALNEMDEKLLVIIDDIDRLPNEQIRLIFQLVNSVAGFPNTIYLLSFDKDIVAQALDYVQGRGAEYLEKIIQVPFEVPPVNRSKLRNIFEDRMREIILFNNEDELSAVRWHQVYNKCVAPFLKTLRDVNRVCNVLNFSYTSVKDEVDAFDMVGICALQVMAPSIYSWIRENKFSLIHAYQGGMTRNEQEQKRNELSKVFEPICNEPEKMIEAVSELFPAFGFTIGVRSSMPTSADLHSARRIADENKFDLYFSLSLEEIKIPHSTLEDSFYQMDEASLRKFLSDLESEGLLENYMDELAWAIHAHRIPQQRIEILVRTVSQRSSIVASDGAMKEAFSVYDLQDLILEMHNEEKANELLHSLFQNADYPTFQYLMHLLHIIELSHGRVADNPSYRNAQLISLEHLISLEKLFIERLHEFIQMNPILNWEQPLRGIILWKFIDFNDFTTYMKEAVEDTISAVGFIALSVSSWYSEGILASYSLEQYYTDLFTKEEALNKINSARCQESFWKEHNDLPGKAAAFTLLVSNEVDDFGVDVGKVKALVEKWRKDYSSKSQ